MGRRALLLIALAAAWAASTDVVARGDVRGGLTAGMPRPSAMPLHGADPEGANRACEGCHEAIATEWRASLHAQANVDPVYRRAVAIEPLPFCRGCHAPEADPRAEAPPALASVGVGCISCHVTAPGVGAPVLATMGSVSSAPHPLARDPAFGTAAACAACHEFDFPASPTGAGSSVRPDRMQSTLTEHATSAYGGTACASCHMPDVELAGRKPHRSHRFSAHADAAMLRSALLVRADRVSPSKVTLSLAAGAVGHAFPTGDLFRRLVVSAEAVDDDWLVVSEGARPLYRHFDLRETPSGEIVRQLVGDDRVQAAAVTQVSLDLGEAGRDRAISWRVEYQRVEHPLRADGTGGVIADSVVVAEGLVAKVEGHR